MTDSNPEAAYTELIPRPDPSKLTDAAITRSTAQYRRELDALRELLSERITALAVTAHHEAEQAKAMAAEYKDERDRAVAGLRELLEERLTGMDRATQLLASDLRQLPTVVDSNIGSLRELMESKLAGMDDAVGLQNKQAAMFPAEVRTEIAHLKALHEERFTSIAQQFNERDIRTDQASRASKEALDAALQAAKELVNAQGEASSAAAVKSETSFAKQIDQIGTIISTLEKALDARITELKERVDRGEGTNAGQQSVTGSPFDAATYRQADQTAAGAQQRALVSSVIAGLAVLISVVTIIVLVLKK